MKRWIVLLLMALGLSAVGWWARVWVPAVFGFVSDNSETIDVLSNVVEILSGIGTLLVFVAGLWLDRRGDRVQVPLPSAQPGPGIEATLQGDGAIAQQGSTAADQGGVAAREIHGDVLTGQAARKVDAGTYVERQEVHQAAPDPAVARTGAEAAERLYLRTMRGIWNTVPLAALGGDQGPSEEIGLDQVYVALDTTTRIPLSGESKPSSAARSLHPEGKEDEPLPALRAAAQTTRMVLLGDPGGGKSAFVRRLCRQAAMARLGESQPLEGFEPGLFPLLVELRELAPKLAELGSQELSGDRWAVELRKALHEHWISQLEQVEASDFKPLLESELESGQILAVFDGLDEVAEPWRESVRKMIRATLDAYSGVRRVIVTCRERSYAGLKLRGFQEYTLAALDRGKIELFVERWYRAQTGVLKIKDKIEDLKSAALGQDLVELSPNPMLLTTMAIIHQREVGLPRERVRLFHDAVDLLLRRWQKHRDLKVSPALEATLRDDLKVRRVMEDLAYAAHSRQAESRREGLLLRGDLLAQLEAPGSLGSAALANEFLDYADYRAGLLVGRGGVAKRGAPPAYSFPHRTFQEYLAGCRMIRGRRQAGEFARRAREGDYWYLAAQLGAEQLIFRRESPELALELAYSLMPVDPPAKEGDWRASLWSGRIAATVDPAILAVDDHPNGGQRYLVRARKRLVEVLRESPLPALERIEAGRVVARLGDPRDEVLLAEKTEWVMISAGPFTMGSRDGDSDALDNEKPQHEFEIPYDYQISKWPVTNAQFAQFVEAGGYTDASLWTEATEAGLWRDGRLKLWTLRDGSFAQDWVEVPQDYGELFVSSNQPRVGVSWYEALAYARWLDRLPRSAEGLKIGWRVTLPSEAEWEKAARGSGEPRIYPWKGGFREDCCNSAATKAQSPSPVGCYPTGASPDQVEDLSGNVWEWTRSLWGSESTEPTFLYPYSERTDEREKLGAGERVLRVVRGGAFLFSPDYVRCAVRLRSSPNVRDLHLGFRVAASPLL